MITLASTCDASAPVEFEGLVSLESSWDVCVSVGREGWVYVPDGPVRTEALSVWSQSVVSVLLLLLFTTILSQWDFSNGKSGCPPRGKPAATKLRYPT